MPVPTWGVAVSTVGFCLFIYWTFLRKRMRKPMCLKDKVVLITGASSGLGEACAKAFYCAGAKVILCARRRGELQRVKDSLLRLQPQAASTSEPRLVTFDLAEASWISSKMLEALSIHGHIDIVINNGGVSYRGQIIDTDLDVHRKVMEVNYFGHVSVTKALLPHMIQRQSGHVVFISSIQGKLSIPFRSAYSASKHAIQAFADCLRAEVHESGISVSVLSPGYISTDLSLNALTGDGSSYAAMDSTTASGMKPDDVARCVLMMVTEAKSEVLLSSALHKVAVYLRNFLPDMYFKSMVKRAAQQRKGQ